METPFSFVSDDLVLANMAAVQVSGHMAANNASLIPEDAALAMIYYTDTAYPIVLLILFIGLLAAHGILTASADTSVTRPPPNVTGPGGKPLPDTRAARNRRSKAPPFSLTKRLSFIWLSAGLVLTFFGDGTNIIAHALAEEWWCGEAAAVGHSIL